MKKILALVATASLMFSCSQEEIIPDVEKIPINISVGQQTRANDTTYENGDEVGIYVVNYDGSTVGSLQEEGNQVDNMRFEYNGGIWTPDAPIYWKDKSTSAGFYAYYPYDASANVSAHSFSVQADQSAEANFWASDFLWGKATKVSPTKSAVPIVTNHSLSRILVDIKPGNGFTESTWAAATKSVKICDVKTSATIDLSTGIATATGNNGEIIPLAAAKTGTTLSYQAMMIPQVVADNSKLVVVTVDGVDYVYRKGFTFKANTQHKFAITVNKSGSSVNVTIGEWTTEEIPDEGTAEEESESESTIPNNQIWYTASSKITPNKSSGFGASIVSNIWDESTNKGVIEFDGDVTEIREEAFMDESIKSITLPNSITKIGNYAFQGCWILENITLPNNITNIPLCTFDGCKKLKNIIIPNSVTKIYESAFEDCSSLTNITIPDEVTFIGMSAFSGCTSITSITIPNNIQTICDYAFLDCTSLTSIYCKPTTPPNPPYSGTWSIFGDKTSGFKIYVPASEDDSIITAYKSATLWSKYADIIEEYYFE